jgi:hypothetical protein
MIEVNIPPINIAHNLSNLLLRRIVLNDKVLFYPGYQVVFEPAFYNLMKEVG